MSVVAEFSMFPVGAGESVGDAVARVVDVVRQRGIRYQLGPMGTAIEGSWTEVQATLDACWQVLAQDHDRVYMVVKVDGRRGKDNQLDGKVDAVERRLR